MRADFPLILRINQYACTNPTRFTDILAMNYFVTICTLLWLTLSAAIARPLASVSDSIGIEQKGGKRYVLHRVDQGQTLFAIARRYGSTVAVITAANPEVSQGIRYDQLIRVPVTGSVGSKPTAVAEPVVKPTSSKPATVTVTGGVMTKPVPSKPRPAEPDASANDGIHVVGTGQTLYRLSVMYHVSQDDLRRWNGLSSDNVRLGQALIVSERAYVDRQPTVSKPDVVKPDVVKPTSKTVVAATPKPEPITKPEPTKPEPAKPVATKPSPATTTTKTDEDIIRPGANAPLPTSGRRITETGLAELIEDSQGSTKFLALHRTAPVGTLVLVRNEENNQSIWVKVIGRIPDTGVNDNVLIKLSSRAFTKLGTNDRRFRAEVSYVAVNN